MANAKSNIESNKIEIYPRKLTGKGGAYKTRTQENLVPAVIYGGGIAESKSGFAISVESRNFLKVYAKYGRSSVIDLSVLDGAPTELSGSKVLVKDIQRHPFKNILLHVDLLQLDLKKQTRVNVPLSFVGSSKGAVEGGIVSILNRTVEIKALPADIPSEIEVDISHLEINESLKVSTLVEQNKSKNFELLFDSDYALVLIAPPAEVEATAQETAAAAAEEAAAADPTGAAAATPAAPAKKK